MNIYSEKRSIGIFGYETDVEQFGSVIEELEDTFQSAKRDDDLYLQSRAGTSARVSYQFDGSVAEVELIGSNPVVTRIKNFLDNNLSRAEL